MVDVNELLSHPHKKLLKHVDGVIRNVKEVTKDLSVSQWAKLVAIFHDLGKINPNFQAKLDPTNKRNGYANHAYFSAFAFFCAFLLDENRSSLKEWLGIDRFNRYDCIVLTVIIAKHHGHLPDLKPENDAAVKHILNIDETKNLFAFLEECYSELPVYKFAENYFAGIEDFSHLLRNEKCKRTFLDRFIFDKTLSKYSLDFYLDTQFTFASLIYADKSDAAGFPTIQDSKKDVAEFCKIYQQELNVHLSSLRPNSDLNKLRTAIREEAVAKIAMELKKGKRVFELTSPTGSGKTLMLLSLAGKIIEYAGNFRIIYALPFLSITEQVEGEVLKIFHKYKKQNFIQRIDSKSKNPQFEKIQEKLDSNPDEATIKELGALIFKESVFAYPFIITTFVRFFETLLSNHNADLLKLPNFSKSIFLLDEIQSLPPRLYSFFVAYLTKFCQKFDCYAVVSTATQPNFGLPHKGINSKGASIFFADYEKPTGLLEHEKYFSDDVFNRYKVEFEGEEICLGALKEKVIGEDESVLVILNTIDDSKDFYKLLLEDVPTEELVLLNTHFTPNDRKKKISKIKRRLESKKRIIAISTQLIEAGVDIDFPVLYRDFAPVSSIVQSAGRCNRNGKLDFGKVVLFILKNRGKIRSELIYGRGKDKDILHFTKDSWGQLIYEECQLLSVQKKFFDRILNELHFAKHTQKKFDLKIDFIQDISDCMFQKIGKFQLIDEQEFGEVVRYFVPQSADDKRFEFLLKLQSRLDGVLKETKKDYSKISPLKFKIEQLLQKMSGDIVQVRLKKTNYKPLIGPFECFGLFKLDNAYYTFEEGVLLDEVCGIL